MSPEVTLHHQNGYLRPMRESDVTVDYVLGLNDPRVNQYLEVRHHLQTYDSVSSFVRMNKDSSDMILWGVWYGEEAEELLVGTVRLHGIDNAKSSCHIGICLFENTVCGKGLGSQAIKRVTEWAFNNLELHNVRAGVNVANVGSQRAFLRAGYNFSHNLEVRLSVGQKATSINIYLAARKYYSKNSLVEFDRVKQSHVGNY